MTFAIIFNGVCAFQYQILHWEVNICEIYFFFCGARF